jgi:hypothetical protein
MTASLKYASWCLPVTFSPSKATSTFSMLLKHPPSYPSPTSLLSQELSCFM